MATTQLDDRLAAFSRLATRLVDEVGRVLVGQEPMMTRLLIGLLSGGHVLLEGVPGLAKTLTVRTLARCIDTGFSRIQFTPDMLPADVIGTEIFNPRDATYSVKRGPIFSNLVLADEINRAPAKVQAALLEAMQERQVTIGDQTYRFEEPFLVLATQNPIEQEGTYPLPEAQVDRFMLKVRIGYPSRDEERRIIDRMSRLDIGGSAPAKADGGDDGAEGSSPAPVPDLEPITTPSEILEARQLLNEVFADDKVRDYIVDVVRATRDPAEANVTGLTGLIEMGASPRASINLMRAARAHALLQGRNYVTPHDVKTLAPDVLRHRVVVSYEAEAEGRTSDDIVTTILDSVLVP
ncbi:MAG: ATPase [Phycisphaeraceae bacterium]|nr:ATPase [Phycisphaeraceae bacterium]